MEEPKPIGDQPLTRNGEFRVQLPGFEGPLDLLLHLTKKHELDILDLPIAFVTERYLEYLKFLQDLDLEVAAEYLLMAATLAHIKSKLLLPRSPQDQAEDGEQAETGDPRLELIRRLLEYQKYKAVAERLGERPVAGRDVFSRGMDSLEQQEPPPLADIGLFRLLDAFQAILDRAKGRVAFEISSERVTIGERMTQMVELLRARRSCSFEELFDEDMTRYAVVVTFLALLEMTRMRIARIYQADYRSQIHIQFALLEADAPSVPPMADDASVPEQDNALATETGAGSQDEA